MDMKSKYMTVVLFAILIGLSSFAITLTSKGPQGEPVAHSRMEMFGPNLRMNDQVVNDRSFPVVAVEDGIIYVVWQDQRSGTGQIYISMSTNNGTTFTPNREVAPIENVIRKAPDIAVFGEKVYIVWEDYRNGFDDSDIYVAHSSDGGRSFGPSIEVNTDETVPVKDWEPSIAVDRSSGNIYIAWVHSTPKYKILAASSTDEGASFKTVEVSDSAVNNRTSPDIAVDATGKVFVVWNDGRNGIVDVDSLSYDSENDVFIANSTDNGESFGTNVAVNDPVPNIRQTNPSLAIDGYNNLHVVWCDARFDPKRFYIMYARSPDGSNFGPNVIVNSSSPVIYGVKMTDHLAPQVAVDPFGNNITVVWLNNRGGLNNDNVYVASSTDGGLSFGPANLKFGGNYFIDSPGTYNGVYDSGEAVLRDNGNGLLDPGVLNGSDSPDRIATAGNANLKQAGTELLYYDVSSNGSWDFGEPIIFDAPLQNYNLDDVVSKTVWDNTNANLSLSYLWHNDSFYYWVNQSEVMGLHGFQSKGLSDDAPISSVMLEITYNTSSGYSGTSPVLWSFNGGANYTAFVPVDTNGMDIKSSLELYPLVNSTVQLKTMNISFVNNDSDPDSHVRFDKVLIKVTTGFGMKFDFLDVVVFNDSSSIPEKADLREFSAQNRIVYMDSNVDGKYTMGEPVIELSHDLLYLNENDRVLQRPGGARWIVYFTPFPLNDDTTSAEQYDPSIAVDEYGNAYAVWKDFRSALPNIYYTDNVDDSWPPNVDDVTVGSSLISIYFSEPVDASSFLAAFSSEPHIEGTWSWDDYGHVATLHPSHFLYPMTDYYFTITTALHDVSGNHMINDFQYRFHVPSIPIIMLKAAPFVEVNEPIPVSARIIDNDGIMSATLLFRSVSEKNYTLGNMSLLFGTTLDGYWTYPIPSPSSLDSIHYYIVAEDVSGNMGRSPFVGDHLTAVIDLEAPKIQHLAVEDAVVNSDITIEATVSDDFKIDRVLLYVMPVGTGNFNPPIEMKRSGDAYSAKFNVGSQQGVLRYFIRAVDSHGNDRMSPVAGSWAPYEVSVVEKPYHLLFIPVQAAGLGLVIWQGFRARKLRAHEA